MNPFLKNPNLNLVKRVKTRLECMGLLSTYPRISSFCVYPVFVFLEETQKHSKLDNLFYRDLNIQNYLQSKLSKEGQVIFSYRTRMSNYSDNFRGSGGTSACPLCQNHPDNQKWSFECSKVNENINIEGKYSNIFSEKITKETINTLMEINKLRTDFLDQRNIK